MTDHATLEANREIGRRVLLEIWSNGRLELADELYAPDYVDHVARGPEPEEVRGPSGLKNAVSLFRTAFPDLQYMVDDQLAERDLVMTRFSARGTHLGPFLEAEPTGKAISYTGIDVNRIVDGRIVESWVQYDALGLLEQLGLVPAVSGAWTPDRGIAMKRSSETAPPPGARNRLCTHGVPVVRPDGAIDGALYCGRVMWRMTSANSAVGEKST